jgi:hypothetical protein
MRSNTQHAFMLRESSAVLVFVVMCFAQAQSQNAILTGIVKDTSGAAVPKAKIDLKASNGQFLRTTTDNAGGFTIESTPGVYTLTASSQGFNVFAEVVANAPIVEQVVLQLLNCTNCETVCDEICGAQPEHIPKLSEYLDSLLPLKPYPPLKLHYRHPKNRAQ